MKIRIRDKYNYTCLCKETNRMEERICWFFHKLPVCAKKRLFSVNGSGIININHIFNFWCPVYLFSAQNCHRQCRSKRLSAGIIWLLLWGYRVRISRDVIIVFPWYLAQFSGFSQEIYRFLSDYLRSDIKLSIISLTPWLFRNSRERNPQLTLMHGMPALRAVRISTSESGPRRTFLSRIWKLPEYL